ncbi:MAG: 30S ribosomal protein S20 [Planctomycetes bacterium]|nr:30S ribosomal protein S20 [Planctomycetota bacterium]
MPNTKSAKKRLRQNVQRRQKNRTAKSAMRTQVRKVRDAAKRGDVQAAEAEFLPAAKQLDRAGAARLIHPNKAARLKSRLQRMIKTTKRLDATGAPAAQATVDADND